MKIDGQKILKEILNILKTKIASLKEQNIIPHLAIILIGDDPASGAYVQQKVLKAKEIGAKVTLYSLPSNISFDKLLKLLKELNNDNNVHGIIVQQPLPANIDPYLINKAIAPEKDVDAFNPETKFQSPIAKAVFKILEEVYLRITSGVAEWTPPRWKTLMQWLGSKSIVIVGKGETGGGPVIKRFSQLGIKFIVIDSKTMNQKLITQNSDIIISAVGKYILKPNMIKKGAILISVGLYRGRDGKLHGDYKEQEIKNKAAFYTPTPGGVGPVNVACLLENLILAAQNSN